MYRDVIKKLKEREKVMIGIHGVKLQIYNNSFHLHNCTSFNNNEIITQFGISMTDFCKILGLKYATLGGDFPNFPLKYLTIVVYKLLEMVNE